MAEETKIKSLLNQLNSNIKRLIGNTDGLEIKADTLNLNTDTLEALIATSNQLLTTISGNNVDVSLLAKETTLQSVQNNVSTIGTPLQNTKIVNPIPQEVGTFEPKMSINKDNVGLTKESTLGLVKINTDKLDITLTALKNFLRGIDNKDFTTLQLSVEALLTELALKAKLTDTQPTSNAKIDILLSALRNDLRGLDEKNFTTLEDVVTKELTLNKLLIENESPLQIDVVGVDTYIGYANAGTATTSATWAVKKITETGDDVSVKWADGNRSKDNIWDNRVSLIYS